MRIEPFFDNVQDFQIFIIFSSNTAPGLYKNQVPFCDRSGTLSFQVVATYLKRGICAVNPNF